MARGKQLAIIVFFFFAISFRPTAVSACSCRGGTPICESYWRTSAVFVGEVVDIADVKTTPSTAGGQSILRKHVRFRVERSFLGTPSKEVAIQTGMGGGDCGYPFARGEQYLVFADESDGTLRVSACGPTRRLADAGEILEYASQQFPPTAAGRIYGTVGFRSGNDPYRPAGPYTITLRNPTQSWTTTSDASGNYEFRVPGGTYSITVQVPDTLMATSEQDVALVDPRGCARRDLTVSPNGRIRTRVITAGPAARKVEVELIDVEALTVRPLFGIPSDEEFVPASGSVHWSGLPPGRYVLGVNITRPATKDNPYPPTFYPGVRDISAAQIFEVGFGQELEAPAFTLPEAPRMLTIHGSIVRTNARAVGGISVFLDSAEPYSVDSQVDSVQAEKDGRFSFTVPAGSRYRVTTIPWNGMRGVSEPFELTPATAPILLVMRPTK